ncbi:hypothetical protein QG37_02761 [Candidozyma auris]|nr:hypothetical protein QG37_02761 [[Candida] auris]
MRKISKGKEGKGKERKREGKEKGDRIGDSEIELRCCERFDLEMEGAFESGLFASICIVFAPWLLGPG